MDWNNVVSSDEQNIEDRTSSSSSRARDNVFE